MIRLVLAALVSAGCSRDGGSTRPPAPVSNTAASSDPSVAGFGRPPTPEMLAGMTSEQRCDAVARRAIPCNDAIAVELMRHVEGGGEELAEAVKESLAAETRRRPDPDAERKIHEANCHGSRHDRFPAAVIACWDMPDCDRFAACVQVNDAPVRRAPAEGTL